jgi:hypothetical protein
MLCSKGDASGGCVAGAISGFMARLWRNSAKNEARSLKSRQSPPIKPTLRKEGVRQEALRGLLKSDAANVEGEIGL